MKKSVMYVTLCALLLSATLSFAQSKEGKKFDEVLNLINTYYTDTVNSEKLTDDAIRKVLEDLDPHSSYVLGKDVKKSEESLVANFEGIGITFQILKDTIMVLEVIPSGPSEKVGLMAGDRIVRVNDTSVAGIKIENEGVIKRLRGPKGTKVKVSVLRASEKNTIDFTIVRDKIPIFSIEASYMATPTVGYVKVVRFSASTMQEFYTAITKLKSQGMRDLLVDMQGNVGGYLYTAVDLCNQFLAKDELIVYTQGEHAPYYPYWSDGKGILRDGKVVVMIDEGTASAGEILSGCIQDNDRGILVGRRTFGKGLVQKPFTLSDGSQVKLTTAHYYTPSGRCIQKPYGKGSAAYRDDYKQRLESGELFGTDTFRFSDSLKYHTRYGRDVFGGGGVAPDVFVKLDTSQNSPFASQLIRKGTENRFCLEYVDKNRAALSAAYPTPDDYFNNFVADSNLLAEYFAAAVTDSALRLKPEFAGKKLSYAEYFKAALKDSTQDIVRDFKKSEQVIHTRLKAIIGRNLFDTQMWHRVINTINDTYEEALRVMANNERFKILEPDNRLQKLMQQLQEKIQKLKGKKAKASK